MNTSRKCSTSATMVVLSFLLSANSCGSLDTRPCPGFGLPLAERWSTAPKLGDSVTFSNPQGMRVTMVLTDIVDSEPFTGAGRFGSENIVCDMTSTRRYGFDDGSTALLFTFRQNAGFNQAPEDHGLFISVVPESPPGEKLPYGYLFNARDPSDVYGTDVREEVSIPRQLKAVRNLEVAGITYRDSVEQRYTDQNYVIELSPSIASAISRIVMTDGGGLVQFELADGTIYTRDG